MPPTQTILTACGIVVALGTAAKFTKDFVLWVYHKARRVETTFDFVESLASNHLPHLQHGLDLICHKLEIEIPPAPPIEYLPEAKKKDRE